MDFQEWLTALNSEAGRRGYVGSATFWQDTGPECWRPSFDDGMTPAEALTADETYA